MTPPALSLRPCSRLPYGRLGVLAPGLGSLDCVLSLDVTGSQQLGTCPGSVVFCCRNSVIVSALERQGLTGPISGSKDAAGRAHCGFRTGTPHRRSALRGLPPPGCAPGWQHRLILCCRVAAQAQGWVIPS